jgi:hypothetical protein
MLETAVTLPRTSAPLLTVHAKMPYQADAPASSRRPDTRPTQYRFPAPLAADRFRVVTGLRLLRSTVTAGVFLFLGAIVLQKTAFDVEAATLPSARADTPSPPEEAVESGSVSPPIGPFLGLVLTAVIGGAIHLCRRGSHGAGNVAFPWALAVVGLGFLGATGYRLAGPYPDSGIVELGLCGVVWFATAVIVTSSLDRIAREMGSAATASKLRERGEYGILIVLVALLAAALLGGIQAIASSIDLTISFRKTPALAFMRTVAVELLIGVAISTIVWLVSFRRVVQDLVYLATESSDPPDRGRVP